MLVLAAVDATTRSATLGEFELPGPTRDVQDVAARVHRLGVRDAVLGRPDVLATQGAHDHRWVYYDDCMHYEAAFPHAAQAATMVSFYAAVALAVGGGPGDSELARIRLAVVELTRHLLRHGRPRPPAPRLSVGFRFGPEGIAGWVQDQCDPLDSATFDAEAGPGLSLAHGVLDQVHHEVRDGNRITFHRRSPAWTR